VIKNGTEYIKEIVANPTLTFPVFEKYKGICHSISVIMDNMPIEPFLLGYVIINGNKYPQYLYNQTETLFDSLNLAKINHVFIEFVRKPEYRFIVVMILFRCVFH